MSWISSKSGPHRAAFVALGVFAVSVLGARPACAAAPVYTDIMPLRQIKPGMTGYGLTTFHGTTISRFEVRVIGVLRKVNNGHDLILIRMHGGPITERGANLIQGMSGSPIYINGKCIGAFSQGETWPKEPIGMVTPIEDMLEAWDPDIPQTPPYFQPAKGKVANTESRISLPSPIMVGNRRITALVLNAHPNSLTLASANTAVLRRATTYAVVGGVTEKERAWFQKELDKRGYAFTLGQTPVMGAGKTNLPATPLKPGSCFGTFLLSGDVEFGAFGTVTYRKGSRILGFGHPFFGFGALNASATSASVVDVFSGVQVSHLIAEAGPVVGTITQDRNFSVSVEMGRKPIQIPFDITVRDETTHRSQTFHSQLFQHPDLTSALLSLIGKAAISRVHNTPGDVMARVTTTVEAAEVGKITRTNLLFDADDISVPAVQDLNEINGVVSGNPFYPLPIKRASMTVDLFGGHNTATVERIFLKQGRYEPGDTLEIGVVLKPYRRESIIKPLSLKIPSDTPNGRYVLAVRGGTAPTLRLGGLSLGGDPQPPPANVGQMIARLNNREKSTDMVVRLMLNTGAPALEGEKLSQLPPNLAVLMRSDRNSGVRIERDELRSVTHSDYILSGSQSLYVTVQRKNTQEPSLPASFTGGSGSPTSGGTISLPTGAGASVGVGGLQDEDEKENLDHEQNVIGGDRTAGNRMSGDRMGGKPVPMTFAPATERWLQLLQRSQSQQEQSQNDLNGLNGLNDKQGKKSKKSKKEPDIAATPIAANSVTGEDPALAPPASDSGPGEIPAPIAPPIIGGGNPVSDTEPIKIVGRQLQTWRQSGSSGFASGKFLGTSVAASGELRIVPRLHRLVSTNETYLWAVVSDPQGNLYAGTGTTGKVLKIDPTGKVTTFAQLPVVSVQSLLRAHDGTLWAGSSVQGKLFHIRQDGTVTPIATLPERYLVALCEDSKGNIYAGAGGGGKVYKVPAGYQPKDADRTDALPPFVTTGGDYVTALAVDPQDNLYVGTGNEGILYRITPEGKSAVLYDAKENSITALALDRSGNVYAGTGPRGLLYRIAPDGTATVVYDRASSFYTGIRLVNDGTLFATTVNAAYHIYPSQINSSQTASSQSDPSHTGRSVPLAGKPMPERSLPPSSVPALVQPLDNPRDVDFLTLALLPDNSIAIGTGNIGEIYTSRPNSKENSDNNQGGVGNGPTVSASQGVFESVIHDCKLISRWGTIRTVALLPDGTRLRVETRTGNVAEPDVTWSRWETPLDLGKGDARILSPAARFIQYRLILTASPSGEGVATGSPGTPTPALREVALSYLPRNQAPRVAFLTPQGGERWAKTQNIRWAGNDPDNDTLTYELFYSTDGATWQPLSVNSSKPGGATAPGNSNTPSGPPATRSPQPATQAGANTLEETARLLAAQGNVPDAIKNQILESVRQRQQQNRAKSAGGDAIVTEVESGTDTTPSAKLAGGATSNASGGFGQRNSSRAFDTSSLPDGTYWLKVVASDIASNPTDPQVTQVISEPFMIVNTLPVLSLVGSPVVTAEGHVIVTGVATQKLISITAVQYRVDGGEWLSATPKDGLFDSTQERFSLTTVPLSAGKHTLEIVAFNAANNRATQKVELTVP